MSVSLWRIGATQGKYRADDLSGAGAAAVGGRYNGLGTAVVYTSVNVALTVLETVVHFGVGAKAHSNKYLVEIEVPDDVFAARMTMDIAHLKQAGGYPFWDAVPFALHAQPVGDQWVAAGASLLLELPSAVVPHAGVPDRNVLINPAHADFRRVKIVRTEKFIYDPRIVAL
jgi:RES domain-containing protein